MRKYQKGIGFLGLVFMFVAIGSIGGVAMKLYPLYFNEMKIKHAVVEVSNHPENTTNPADLRHALDRWWDIDRMDFLTSSDVKLSNDGKGRALVYDYYARADIVSNVSVIIHFTGNFPIQGGGRRVE